MNEAILENIKKLVMNCQSEETRQLVQKVIKQKTIDPLRIINEALIPGIRELGKRFEDGDAFITDLIMGANAIKASYEVILPHLASKDKEKIGKFLIGTVEGDVHDIGKEIVKNLLEAYGFEVEDLGVDVSTETFINKIKEYKPDILGMSALLTITMENQKNVIEALKKENLRDKVNVMVGGAPTTQEWATEIGADAYAEEAMQAVKKAIELMKTKK